MSQAGLPQSRSFLGREKGGGRKEWERGKHKETEKERMRVRDRRADRKTEKEREKKRQKKRVRENRIPMISKQTRGPLYDKQIITIIHCHSPILHVST